MLHSFNALYPHFYNMVASDNFVSVAKNMLDSHEAVIEQNEELKYLGHTIVPALIIDVDADNFEIQDLFGENITSILIQVFYGTEWHNVSFGDSIPKTDPSYVANGTKLYVKATKEDSLIKRTIFRTKELDYHILAQAPLTKFEFFINAQAGCYIIGDADETVVSVDVPTMTLVTDLGTYELQHTEYISTLSNGDTVAKFTVLDKIFDVSADDGSTVVSIKNGFHHLSTDIRSDINIKVELAV